MYVEASLDMSEKYYIFEADFGSWELKKLNATNLSVIKTLVQ